MRVIDFADDLLTQVAHFVTPEGSGFWGVYTLPGASDHDPLEDRFKFR